MNYSFIVPGVLVLFIIMGYYFFRPRLQIRLNRAFLAILIINIGLQLFECIASLMNESPEEKLEKGLPILQLEELVASLFRLLKNTNIYADFIVWIRSLQWTL